MEQLRTYKLIDKATAEHYLAVHWANHVKHLPKYGFEIQGVWIGDTPDIANEVMVIVSFPDHEDVEEMTQRYFKSPEFMDNMKDFDRSNFVHIETKIIRPAKWV